MVQGGGQGAWGAEQRPSAHAAVLHSAANCSAEGSVRLKDRAEKCQMPFVKVIFCPWMLACSVIL